MANNNPTPQWQVDLKEKFDESFATIRKIAKAYAVYLLLLILLISGITLALTGSWVYAAAVAFSMIFLLLLLPFYWLLEFRVVRWTLGTIFVGALIFFGGRAVFTDSGIFSFRTEHKSYMSKLGVESLQNAQEMEEHFVSKGMPLYVDSRIPWKKGIMFDGDMVTQDMTIRVLPDSIEQKGNVYRQALLPCKVNGVYQEGIFDGTSESFFVQPIHLKKFKAEPPTKPAPPDKTPPRVSVVRIEYGPDHTTALVRFATDERSTGEVRFGPTGKERTEVEPVATDNHSVLLTKLTPGQEGYYSVSAVDAAGNRSTPTPLEPFKVPAPVSAVVKSGNSGMPAAVAKDIPVKGGIAVVSERCVRLQLPTGNYEVTLDPARSKIKHVEAMGRNPGEEWVKFTFSTTIAPGKQGLPGAKGVVNGAEILFINPIPDAQNSIVLSVK